MAIFTISFIISAIGFIFLSIFKSADLPLYLIVECIRYRVSPKKYKEAKQTAKDKIDEFLDAEIKSYFKNNRDWKESQEREKEQQRKYNKSYWEEAPKFSRNNPETLTEKHQKVLGIPLGQKMNKTILMKAYKNAAIKAHPDKGGSKEAFIKVQQAKEFLEKIL